MVRTPRQITDGLSTLRAEMDVTEVMRLIERTARWVSLETFRRLPVWFPEHSRRGLFYKANWSERQLNKRKGSEQGVHKEEGNTYANKALTHALGLRSFQRPNWSCCHIWGVDDPTYAAPNLIVQDARFYSCVANMVLLPTPLTAFTDVVPEVKAMLRACAAQTYDWLCDHEGLDTFNVERWTGDTAYPCSWPRARGDAPPPGTVELTPAIADDCDKRLREIHRDLDNAGPFYPREAVAAALRYWRMDLPESLHPPHVQDAL